MRISGGLGASHAAINNKSASKKLIVDRNFRMWVITNVTQPNISDSVHKIDSDSIDKEVFAYNSHVIWSERVPSDAEHEGETSMDLSTAIEGFKRRKAAKRGWASR